MSLTVPKICWPAGSTTNTLNFDYPPVRQNWIGPLSAVRHQNVSSAGVVEYVKERVDEFQTLQIEYAKSATIASWSNFINAVLDGSPFDYYPDATSGTHTKYTLEDSDFTAEWKSLGMATFNLRFRKYVSWP